MDPDLTVMYTITMWKRWLPRSFDTIKARRELLESLGQTYRAPSYGCSPRCCVWDYRGHASHAFVDLGRPPEFGDAPLREWNIWFAANNVHRRLAYEMLRWEATLAYPDVNKTIRKVVDFYDGPYGTGQTPNAATMHLFVRRLVMHELGLGAIVVGTLFARLGMPPYPKMHHDAPHIRMSCQLFMMFPTSFAPVAHCYGLAKAVMGRRRGDPKRRGRVLGYIKRPANYLGVPTTAATTTREPRPG